MYKKTAILRARLKHVDLLNEKSEYENKFNNELVIIKKSNLKYTNTRIFKLKISNGSNKIATLNAIISNKADLAIVKSTLFLNHTIRKVQPYFQTLTRESFNDKSNASKDEMQKYIIQINEYLKKNQYKNWTDKKQKWNGAIYQELYSDPTNFTNSYRGMIIICGTERKLKAIKKSWNNKNWDAFVNFGILAGNKFNKGKYLLQNELLIQNFGTEADLNKSKNNCKILSGLSSLELKKHGFSQKHKIAFTYANSFAWTHNTHGKTSLFIPINPKEKIEVLAYTRQYLYDVGVFNINYSKLEKELITKTFISLSKKGEDDLGAFAGYDSYDKIINIEKFYKDIK